MTLQVDITQQEIEDFCRRNQIQWMAFFGSVLRDDFTSESDVDVLVAFMPEARVGFLTLAEMEIELSRILDRRAEIHTVGGLHPLFRDEVLDAAEVQYEQA